MMRAVVLALSLFALAGCKSSSGSAPCPSLLSLRFVLSEPAASAESVVVFFVDDGSGNDPTTQTFMVPVGATELTVMVDVGAGFAGRTVGVRLVHGGVIVGISSAAVHDTCSTITVDSWTVDQGMAPHD